MYKELQLTLLECHAMIFTLLSRNKKNGLSINFHDLSNIYQSYSIPIMVKVNLLKHSWKQVKQVTNTVTMLDTLHFLLCLATNLISKLPTLHTIQELSSSDAFQRWTNL